ncbi:MAG: AmmeMemoRadiSam system protein B [Halodesulfurarchaeum sp.]
MTGTRSPAVAGQFYANGAAELREQIEAAFEHPIGPGERPAVESGPASIRGLVSPHAGYPYSGPVAAHGFARLARAGRPEAVVLLGPNHGGFGAPIAMSGADRWETPLGSVPVETELRAELESYPGLTVDESTHEGEHSLEVQVPFLQYLYDDPVPILPIVLTQQSEESVDHLRSALAETITGDTLVLASTDLTHYEPASAAERLDESILDAIEGLDADRIVEAARDGHTMCGWAPTAATLSVSRDRGAESGDVLTYATSGDTAGSADSVVGYVSAVVA